MVHSRAARRKRSQLFLTRSTAVRLIGAAFNRPPDDFRTSDVRIFALTACHRRTHVEPLGEPPGTAKDPRRRKRTFTT
jgi:hypothetical protein